jgi:hypothetical protein
VEHKRFCQYKGNPPGTLVYRNSRDSIRRVEGSSSHKVSFPRWFKNLRVSDLSFFSLALLSMSLSICKVVP